MPGKLPHVPAGKRRTSEEWIPSSSPKPPRRLTQDDFEFEGPQTTASGEQAPLKGGQRPGVESRLARAKERGDEGG